MARRRSCIGITWSASRFGCVDIGSYSRSTKCPGASYTRSAARRPRQRAADELRPEGLVRAGELGDVVLFQLALLGLGERRGDGAADRRGVDHLDPVRRLGDGRRRLLSEQGSDGEKKDRGQTNRHL